MTRAVPTIIVVFLAAWGGWLVYQYATESPTAHRLFERQVSALGRLPMRVLARAADAGEHRRTVAVQGRSYRIRWSVTAPPAAAGDDRRDPPTLSARVNVDYLDLLPFGDVKLGPAARFTITTKTDGRERSEFKRSF